MSDLTRLAALLNDHLPPEAGVEAHAILDRLRGSSPSGVLSLHLDEHGFADAIDRGGEVLLHLVPGTVVNANNAAAFVAECNGLRAELAELRAERDEALSNPEHAAYSWKNRGDVLAEINAELRARVADLEADPKPTEIRLNPDGTLDEVVGHGSFHLEQMNDGHWWMLLDGVHVNLVAKGKVRATYFDDDGRAMVKGGPGRDGGAAAAAGEE